MEVWRWVRKREGHNICFCSSTSTISSAFGTGDSFKHDDTDTIFITFFCRALGEGLNLSSSPKNSRRLIIPKILQFSLT